MRRMPWAIYLWPGLPQLWFGGLSAGLVLATGCAILLNLLLLASFVWIELLDAWHLWLGWSAIGLLWTASAIMSAWFGRREAAPQEAAVGDLFREALSEYLQRSWFEAERILERLLHSYPRDVEARLLLATLLRHTGRHCEALDELGRLELLRDADHWAVEIASERRLLAQAQAGTLAIVPRPTDDDPSQPVSQQAA
jgi:hypothetical protein